MISLAISSMSPRSRFSRRSAAFCITPGSVLMPTVKVLGTLMRMFCSDRARWRGMPMVMGVRLIKA